MSKIAWCDLNSKGDNSKLHDHCSYHRCKCQKQSPFTPRQIPLEGASIKNTMEKNL